METFAKGDIVLFPFPFTDLSERKIRPCLVLSEEMRQDIILCQITSRRVSGDRFTVNLDRSDMRDGSLNIESWIRTNMIFTAEKSQILRKMCRVDTEKYQQVVQAIMTIIG